MPESGEASTTPPNPGAAAVRPGVDPRVRVLYLATVAVGIFVLRSPVAIAAIAVAQLALGVAVRIPPQKLARHVVKLWGFSALLLVSYAFTSEDPATDRWVPLVFGVQVNLAGMQVAGLMILRVLSVVLASQVVRAGDPRALAAGLRGLGVPAMAAAPIDAVLALLGGGDETAGRGRGMGGGRGDGSGGGRGGGGGGGGGGGDAMNAPSRPSRLQSFWAAVKQLAAGDVTALLSTLDKHIDRAERHAKSSGLLDELGKSRAKDAAVISGVALTMLGVRALKILPSIPFAPGHKLVVLTPLYIVASVSTTTRFGGTLTGLAMGTTSLSMGDGRYGVFEVLKHTVPGLISDLLAKPLARGAKPARPWAWTMLGALIGAGRFATIAAVVYFVQAPMAAYAILAPGFAVHVTFGALSGYVTYHSLIALKAREKA